MSDMYSHIPSVDKILRHPLLSSVHHASIKKHIQQVLNTLRQEKTILSLDEIAQKSLDHYQKQRALKLIPIINATGIIIHTNLGRSPLSQELYEEVMHAITSYNNLEMDLQKGQRGERYNILKGMINEVLGCEDLLIVNNNAAALFLILNTFAKNKEVIISRGELIEIGGNFRIPEVLENAGAVLKEVGTTNKTHAYDYINAINDQSAILLKVHCSNYQIQGFTQEVSYEHIIDIAQKHKLIDCYDMGSGFLSKDFIDNKTLHKELKNLYHEPTIEDIISHNPSLITFSGDKLLGSVQAGLILGKKHLIDQLKTNQLLRMLRIDKITLALLEASFRAYFEKQWNKIPILKLLRSSTKQLSQKASTIIKQIPQPFICEISPSTGYIGGGALPQKEIPSIAIKLKHPTYDATMLKNILRKYHIIARTYQNELLLEMRTLLNDDDEKIIHALHQIACKDII